MKFFRQKSHNQQQQQYDQKRHSISKSICDSFEEILKTLRCALLNTTSNGSSGSVCECSGSSVHHCKKSNDSCVKSSLEKLLFAIKYKVDTNDALNCGTTSSSSSCAFDDSNGKDYELFIEQLFATDIMAEIVERLPHVDFESKKVIANIVRNALLLRMGDTLVTVEYMAREPRVLFALIESYGYGRSDITLNCGQVLRDCIAHECLARIVLESPHFFQLFSHVNQTTFDVAMDAFITFRLLLVTHKTLSAHFLSNNYRQFSDAYHHLLRSDNYVTKRQSLEILALILKERSNCSVRQQFVKDDKLMKLIVHLFWHRYKHIRFRAINVFNVILSGDDSTVWRVLFNELPFLVPNKDKLVAVLDDIRNECDDFKLFFDQKPFVTKMLTELKS